MAREEKYLSRRGHGFEKVQAAVAPGRVPVDENLIEEQRKVHLTVVQVVHQGEAKRDVDLLLRTRRQRGADLDGTGDRGTGDLEQPRPIGADIQTIVPAGGER